MKTATLRTTRTGTRRTPLAIGIAALAAFAFGIPAQATNYYWSGDNQGSAAWNILTGIGGTNWSSSTDFNQSTSGGTALPGSADDVFFILTGAGNLTNILGTDFSIRSLTFTSDATSAIDIGGGHTLTLGSGGITNGSASSVTLSTNVALGFSGTQTWANNTATSFALSGVLSGAVGNNLTLRGSGTFTFSNANTYSGSTTVFTGGLNLNGSGSILNTSAIALNAGTSLVLDNTTTNVANRIADILTITTKGATINFIGNAATTAETVGTLAVGSGASVMQTSGAGSSLTFGSAGVLPSFSRSTGGTALFAVGAGSTVNAPNLTLANGIIGGWAVTGTAAGTGLDFATRDGSNNIVPFTSYTTFTTASVAADNAKYNATGNPTVNLTANTTVNSLYLTGASTPVTGTGVVPPASYVVNSNGSATPTRTYGNGITFSNGAAGNQTVTLTIGSGGIISSGATGTGFYNNKANIGNMAFIGYLFDESGGANGRVTAGAGIPDLVVYTDSNLRIASIIVDNGSALGLTKSGPGLLDLSNGNNQTAKHSNTFTGKVTINEGVLLINAAGQLGNSASALDNVTFNGGELRTFAGFNTNTAQGWTVGTRGGTFSYTGGNDAIVQNRITGVGGFTYYARQTGGGGGARIRLGNNLGAGGNTSNSDYQGATNFSFSYADGNDGTGDNSTENIVFNQNDQVPHSAGTHSAVNINMVRDNATRDIVANTIGKSIDLNGRYQFFGSLAGNVNIAKHDSTTSGGLTLGGNNLSTVYTGSIYGTNNATAGSGSLTKVGTGTQTLSGADNRFSGATAINGGTLLIGSGTGTTSTAALFNSPVTVGNGTLTGSLGGNGTINSTVTVTSTGHLAPAMSATTTNTLTINNNLTLSGGATLDYNFGALGTPGTSDLVSVGGAFNLTLNAGTDILNINQLPGFGIGTYNLLTLGAGAGTFTNNATFTINGKNNFNYAVGTSGRSVVLTVTAGNPILTWIGNVNNVWSNGGPTNWNNGTGAVAFADTNNVVFDDNLSGSSTVAVSGTVLPNSVLFDNSTTNYSIGGGTITVATNIIKQQAGTATLTGLVNAPITTISAGTLAVGAGGTLNSTTKLDVNGGALNVDGTLNTPTLNVKAGTNLTVSGTGALSSTTALDVVGTATFLSASPTIGTLTGTTAGTVNLSGFTTLSISSGSYNGTIAGGGGLAKIGAGTLTLTGATNSFTGGVAVKNGTLSVAFLAAAGTAQPLGAGTGDIVLGDAATTGTLQYTGSNGVTNRGITVAAGGGRIESTTAAQFPTLSGAITNGANSLTLLGAGDGLISGTVGGTGNLVKQGGGTWTLSGTGVSGATVATTYDVQSGTLTGVSNGTSNPFGAATIGLSGGTLGLSSTTAATFDNPINVTQNATINAFQSAAGGGAATQTVAVGSGTSNVSIASAKVLTLATANGYTMNVAGNLTGAGSVTSTGTVNLNGTGNNYSGPTSVTGGTFSVNGGLNTTGTATVTGGTFNANAPLSVNNLIVGSGTYNGAAALTSTNGVTVSGGTAHITAASGGLSAGAVNVSSGVLQFDAGIGNTATFTGTGLANDGLLQVATGTADLGGTIITTTKPQATAGAADQLSERYFRPSDVGIGDFSGANGDPFISFEGTNTFLTRTPGATGILGNTDLNFTNVQLQTRANALSANFYPTTDNQGAAWVGRLTVGGANLPAGAISFGTNTDDGSSLYIDSNQDGAFQAGERVISNLGPHGVVTVTNTITLAAGTYNFAVGFYNGNGGGQVDVKFAAGSGVAFASQAFVNPGSASQSGIFSTATTPGGTIQVDSGAQLIAGGFTADVVNFTSGATAGTLTLGAHASSVASAANSLTMQGANTQALLDLGANNNVTIAAINLGTNGTLTKSGAGTLIVSGTGSGTGTVVVASGNVTVSGSLSGSAQINNGGTLQVGVGGATGALGSGAITDNGALIFNRSDTLTVANAITGTGTVTNAGGASNVLNLNGAQNYAVLNANAGTTNVNGSFTSGTAIVNANATTNFTVSQKLGALNIGTGALAGVNAPAFAGGAVVPEPGALGLLTVGILGLLARRRRV